MSGADFFDDNSAINPYMQAGVPVDKAIAHSEHEGIKRAFEQAGITVIQVAPPINCQDGIYTANWALVREGKAVLARLPNARKGEEAYAKKILQELGKEVITIPGELRFSGQGDALPCGNYLFAGNGYRSDREAQQFAADQLGYEMINLQTIPQLDASGHPVVNAYSGWPDSFFYDIDLALSVLRVPTDAAKGLIAWCPDAFTPGSQEILRNLSFVDKIEVSLEEATGSFACNLVSRGDVVVMGAHAPQLQAAIESHGFAVITPEVAELTKGGGYIRCTSLTLDN